MNNHQDMSPREQALDLTRNISVTAGAGSGKTRILVDRFLKIVLDNPKMIRRTLAITFTEKAAGELQERIALEINEKISAADSHEEKNRLLYIRDHLNSAYISTIHGFCSKILHEFPFESGISPDFKVLEDLERAMMIRNAIRQKMESIDILTDPESVSPWYDFFRYISRTTTENILEKLIGKPYEMECILDRFAGMTESDYIRLLEKKWLEIFDALFDDHELRRMHEMIQTILTGMSTDPASDKGRIVLDALRAYRDAFEENRDSLHARAHFITLIRIFTKKDGTAYSNLSQLGGKNDWDEVSRENLLALSHEAGALYGRLHGSDPGPLPGEIDRQWFLVMRRFFTLYKDVYGTFQTLKLESGAVDFDDLQLFTLRLLDNNRIRNELSDRFDAILVDEFQDTDRLQWNIIKRLSEEDGSLSSSKLFIVGDPKQSIYGFRNADIRVFREVKQLFADKASVADADAYEGNITFPESYRFLPRLNAFINYLFSQILIESPVNPYEVGYDPLDSKRELPGTGETEIALFSDEEEKTDQETQFIVTRIRDMQNDGKCCYIWDKGEQFQPVRYGDIAILLRSRTNLLNIEQSLRSAGIPFKTVGGIGFWQRQEIFDFYHLLRFLSNPADDLAMVAVLRSPMFMIPDTSIYALSREKGDTWIEKLTNAAFEKDFPNMEDKKILLNAREHLVKWLGLRDRIPLSDLLFTIMEDTSLKAILSAELNGEQLAANLDKLIGLAQSFDYSGLGGLSDFIANIDDLITNEIQEAEALVDLEDMNTVKIMTIHASKGLQFPVVFVPFLNTQPRGNRDPFFIDSDLGFAARIRQPGSGNNLHEHALYHLLKMRQKQKDLAESKRLFYVAATRSSNLLFLSATLNNKIKPDSALEWLHACFTGKGMNILEETVIEESDFRVRLHHHLPESDKADGTPSAFFKDIEILREHVSISDASGDASYMRAIESPIRGRIFSATMIMTFLKDPNAYYERYHLGFFEGDYELFSADERPDDFALVLGKLVHRYLEKWQTSVTDRSRRIESLFYEFDILDPEIQIRMQSEMQAILDKLVQSDHADRILVASGGRNEVSVTTRINSDYLTGTLDRVIQNSDGLWEVVDYKTNRVTPGTLEQIAARYDWQIKTYALLLSRLYPDQEVFPVSLFFVKPDLLHVRRFSGEDIAAIEDQFIGIIDNIKETMIIDI